jgi:hypothetical protein
MKKKINCCQLFGKNWGTIFNIACKLYRPNVSVFCCNVNALLVYIGGESTAQRVQFLIGSAFNSASALGQEFEADVFRLRKCANTWHVDGHLSQAKRRL